MQDSNVSAAVSPGMVGDTSEGPPQSALTRLSPLLRRVIADNRSPFTFTGTCSYIVGEGKVAIVDPGPADHPAHLAALLDAVRGESVSHIVVTHTHRDHSPAARALKAATGAPIVGCGPHRPARERSMAVQGGLDSGGDRDHHPDLVMQEGDIVTGPGWTLSAIATPGHTANHLAFALPQENALLSGDHVMAWSTTIVAPPDGAMSDYMASLHKLARRSEPLYLSGHGMPIKEAPRFVQHLIRHRQAREASILHRLRKGAADIPTIVKAVYIGLDPRLVGAAGLSVLAHMEDLVARGVVATDGPPSIAGTYRLAVPGLGGG